MTIAAFYPAEVKLFRSILADIRRLVDPDVRLPAWPFRAPKGIADICQYSNAIEGPFGPVLQSLVDYHGDASVSLVVLDPSPQYYRDGYGSYPAFRVAGSGLADTYWDLVAHEPRNDPTGAVIYTAEVVAIVGSSGQWCGHSASERVMQPCVPRSWAGISNFIEDVLGSSKGSQSRAPIARPVCRSRAAPSR